MSETPSKLQPIECENINGKAYGATNVSVIDEMSMAHFNNPHDRAFPVESIMKTMTCPDLTPIDCIYGWNPES